MNAPATAHPRRKSLGLRILGWAVAGIAGLAAVAGVAAWLALRASLPQLEGEAALSGLGAAVQVQRDAEGVPTIRARSPRDLAFALGFVHGQERFFQMDLQRRAPAGELAALLGPKMLATDRKLRPHGLRAVAEGVVQAATADERALLAAYADGVNAGLAALHARPFEYLLLRQQPRPWQPADTVLTVHAMFLTLQDSEGNVERQRAAIHEALPELEAFLFSPAGQWQAPLFGAPLPDAPVPAGAVDARLAALPREPAAVASMAAAWPLAPVEELDSVVGSNNWALSGKHTANGAALVADDMHLAFRLPHIWFRARLETLDANGQVASAVTGVSLPGTPMVVAGSNGHIAWGFTNSNVDTTDAVVLVPDPANAANYLTPAGPRPLVKHTETLEVRGGKAEQVEVLSSDFGPVVGQDASGRSIAVQWVPQFVGGTNLHAMAMASAKSVGEALAVARGSGIPAQNLTVGDSAGDIAWTVMGQVPQRRAAPLEVPRLSTDPAAAWWGVGPVPEALARLNPADGRIWTANARVGGIDAGGLSAGDQAAVMAYQSIGGSRFDRGARNRQIRDGLAKLEAATPADFLAIHLDDRALFLARWQPLALEVAGIAKVPAADREYLAEPFTRAATDSVSYRLVRAFQREATKAVWSVLTAPAAAQAGELELKPPPEFEGALWQLVGNELAPRDPRWNAVLTTALSTALANEAKDCGGTLAGCTWGRLNTVRFRHPMSGAVPGLSWLVDLPDRSLPGDSDLPRVQRSEHGASERFAVSPGHESDGYLQVPGGNAGHPLSPYHGAGHAAWERGDPVPFLPGAPRWTLTLQPSP